MTIERRTENSGIRLYQDGKVFGFVYKLGFTGDWACILCFPEGEFDLGFTCTDEAGAITAVESAHNEGRSFADWQNSRDY